MEKTLITSGKTIEAAVEAACAQLGLSRDDISYQVLSLPKSGFLGIGNKKTFSKDLCTFAASAVLCHSWKSVLKEVIYNVSQAVVSVITIRPLPLRSSLSILALLPYHPSAQRSSSTLICCVLAFPLNI